jgi:hypothetical protein
MAGRQGDKEIIIELQFVIPPLRQAQDRLREVSRRQTVAHAWIAGAIFRGVYPERSRRAQDDNGLSSPVNPYPVQR